MSFFTGFLVGAVVMGLVNFAMAMMQNGDWRDE